MNQPRPETFSLISPRAGNGIDRLALQADRGGSNGFKIILAEVVYVAVVAAVRRG